MAKLRQSDVQGDGHPASSGQPMSTLASLQRQTTASRSQFRRDVFIIASVVAAVILVSIVAVPQWLSKQARWEVLRAHVGQIGQLAASAVDGDLHHQLLDTANYSAELYARAVKPLVRFHSANSDLFYVYTMAVRDHVPYFILDTATSADLHTKYDLQASAYMQPFKLRSEYEDGWLDQIASGKTYVTPTYEHDDYGISLTSHVPIYDSRGGYSGFVGVDFDMQYYLAEEARFRVIEAGSRSRGAGSLAHRLPRGSILRRSAAPHAGALLQGHSR
jgi:hypothetical protein